MEWKREYSVGIEEIDAQHKTLLGHFSKVNAAISGRESWSETHFRIVDLKEFAEFHFRFEDALMRLYACPERDDHNAMHGRFLRELEGFERSSLTMTKDDAVPAFFTRWLIDHIQGDDQAYSRRILGGTPVVASRP